MGTLGLRLRRRPDQVLVDRGLAVLCTVLAQLSLWTSGHGDRETVAAGLLALVITVPIAVRRRHPALVGILVPAVSSIDHAAFGSATSSIAYPLATFLAMYALAVWTSTRRFVVGLVVLAAAAVLPYEPHVSATGQVAGWVMLTTTVMVLVRRIVGDRDRRAQLAERERDVATREAVLDERSRIARELHDVIAHNVSMVVVQAGAERRVLDGTQSATRDVLADIERTGRAALSEMRRLVGMLRTDPTEPLTPQPSLDDLPALIARVREAGLPVELDVDGERGAVPAGVELSAYRIIQEALTNALKHAVDARARVHVSYGPDTLLLEISDDGGGPAQEATAAGGHGLVGMRERVTMYGGRFTAGSRPGGGFAVRVVLPIR